MHRLTSQFSKRLGFTFQMTKIIIYPSFFYHISCKSEDYKYYSRKSKSKLLSTDDVHKETIMTQQRVSSQTIQWLQEMFEDTK
jgi:hypothetical protein